jgi:class 3 adenylate cyclase
MPIFMDRHDMMGSTAEDVAAAHRMDLQVQDRCGVKFMAYWFDEDRHAAFCLVHGPDAAAVNRAHRQAHGQIANAVLPVDLAAVEAFLGRIGDLPAGDDGAPPTVDAGLRAIMFTDIVGSTEMTARLGDVAALELVRAHDALVRRSLERHGGREIKRTGDGMMASFASVTNAVCAAADIQRDFARFNAEASEGLRVRVGVEAGEPVEDHRDLFGATVQMAARLCGEAEADEIVVSGFVRELCELDPARFDALGERRLKGFVEATPIYRYEWR